MHRIFSLSMVCRACNDSIFVDEVRFQTSVKKRSPVLLCSTVNMNYRLTHLDRVRSGKFAPAG
jgi:hypothetical protein